MRSHMQQKTQSLYKQMGRTINLIYDHVHYPYQAIPKLQVLSVSHLDLPR